MIQKLVYTPFVAQRTTKFHLCRIPAILEPVGCCLPSEVMLHKGTNYSSLVFIFIGDDPEAHIRRTETLCWLAQGKEKPGRLCLSIFFDIGNKIYLILIKKKLTALFILLLRYPKITSKMRMMYYSEELRVICSHAQ